jgi:hypothetical protein
LRHRELAEVELFDAGKSCRDVVIELRQPASVGVVLHNDFARLYALFSIFAWTEPA